VLAAAFPSASVCPVRLWQDLEGIKPEGLLNFRLYSGHLTGSFADFLGHRLRTVTLLRDPVQRTISHYAHVRRDPGSKHHRVSKTLSLREFCLHPETRHLVENYQTRFLAGQSLDAPSPWSQEIALPDSPEQFNEILARAREVLSDCIAVGVSERLPETLTLFADALKLKWSGVTPYENASYNRPEAVDPETLALIRDLTACDALLHREAMERLHAQMVERALDSGSANTRSSKGRPVRGGSAIGGSLAARLALPELSHRLKLRLSRILYRTPRPVRVVLVALYRLWVGFVSWWRGPHGRLLTRAIRAIRHRLGQAPEDKINSRPFRR
jgi:hypothetical protein